MIVGVPKEVKDHEARVGLLPSGAALPGTPLRLNAREAGFSAFQQPARSRRWRKPPGLRG